MFDTEIKALRKLQQMILDLDPHGVDEDLTEAFVHLRKANNSLKAVSDREARGRHVGSKVVK